MTKLSNVYNTYNIHRIHIHLDLITKTHYLVCVVLKACKPLVLTFQLERTVL